MKTFVYIMSLATALAAVKSTAGEPPRTEEGFRIPAANYAFSFPRDHGSHPDFRIEWWYITGHLRDETAHRYGFQATFFRYALHSNETASVSAFGTNQLFMAHMALTDIDGERFMHEERFNRDGWDAHAATHDLDLRNGNWTLIRAEDDSMMLQASILTDVVMNLKLEPVKPFVFFGKDRLSQKGAEPSACSWYITHTRLKTTGQLELDGRALDVSGESWMDHEISSSQLGRDQVGWDWLSVRFDDGQEMMVYILRNAAGEPDPHSTLAWIDQAGTVRQVGPDRFKWSAAGDWTSPETGSTYPIDVILEGTRPDGTPFLFTVKPLLRAQEMEGKLSGIAYWEGACDVYENNRRVGEAYMELTGYGESLNDRL